MYYCCGITSQGVMPHNEDAFLIHKTVITDGALEAKLAPPFCLGSPMGYPERHPVKSPPGNV